MNITKRFVEFEDCGHIVRALLTKLDAEGDNIGTVVVTSPAGVESYLVQIKGRRGWFFLPWNEGKESNEKHPLEGPINEATAMVIARLGT
jgi:hypothetical protein